jgi:predicted ATPase
MTSLIIENFKCFKNQSIDFGDLTVLAGGNSVGKSSVVQAMLLIRICLDRARSLNLSLKRVKIPLTGLYSMALGNTTEVLNRNSDNENINFSLLRDEVAPWGISLYAPQKETLYSLVFIEFTGPMQAIDSFTIGQSPFYYLNAERIGPRLRYEVEDTEYRHVGWNGELAIQVLSQNLYLDIPTDRCFKIDAPNQLLEQARLWLKYITPGTRLDDAKIYSEIKIAEVSLGDSRPTNVGFGLSYVLPIIVNGLIAQEGSLFIIENPEAHLHPSGQSNIGKFLAKIAASGVQVIIETHSEHVINGIRLAALEGTIPHNKVQINFFDRDENESVRVKSIQLNEKADLTEWPNGFFDQQERDLSDIFRLKRQQKR